MVTALLTGVAAALSLAVVGVRVDRRRRVPIGLMAACLAAAAVATALGSALSGRWHALVVILALVAAGAGGSQVTTAVFEAIDAGDADEAAVIGDAGDPDGAAPTGTLRSAGEILRGGLWIGILERLAIFVTLVARWPEGIAVVLAVKGLGRYPELRTGRRPGLAERFIIGTLVSVLWASLCAYAATGPALG